MHTFNNIWFGKAFTRVLLPSFLLFPFTSIELKLIYTKENFIGYQNKQIHSTGNLFTCKSHMISTHECPVLLSNDHAHTLINNNTHVNLYLQEIGTQLIA